MPPILVCSLRSKARKQRHEAANSYLEQAEVEHAIILLLFLVPGGLFPGKGEIRGNNVCYAEDFSGFMRTTRKASLQEVNLRSVLNEKLELRRPDIVGF